MKHVVLMCLLIYIHTSESEIFNRSVTVGKDITLWCKHKGNVTWGKDENGRRVEYLTAETNGETRKLISDPHNRYSVLDDLSLEIKNVSLSDSGIYYCNATPTVNLIVTEADSTASNNRQTEATPPKPETTTSSYSQPGATTPTAVISTNTTQPTQSNSSNSEFNSTKETTTSDNSQPGTTTPTTTAKPTLDSSAKTTCCTTNTTTITEKSTTTTTRTNTITTTRKSTTENNKENKPTYITAAVLGGVLVLILLLWACIKRKSLSSALSNKKENIYETVDDSCSTVHPAPPQKNNDAIYYLAGDPDVVKIGKRQEFDDPTYTLIGLSESKENLNEQGPDVPLYSTIKEFSE